MFSPGSLLMTLLLVILLFGTKKLRNMGEDLGAAVKGFQKGLKEEDKTSNTHDRPQDPT